MYPLILRFLKGKEYISEEIKPPVSVIVVGKDTAEKVNNIQQCDYPEIEIIEGGYGDTNKVKGEIIVFTDTKTKLDLAAIGEIVKPFADEQVGAVVGQQTNPEGNSAFWKYENLVKRLESRIGCVSGANESLLAIRKNDMPEVPSNVLNKPFYIVTKITETGRAVIFHENAKAYEGKTEGVNFKKHVEDAAGYWQALVLFPKMLLPQRVNFVYISHRVLKWFVWMNLLFILITSGVLAVKGVVLMTVLFNIQIVTYLIFLTLGRRNIGGVIGKLLNIGHYFTMFNISFFLGLRINKNVSSIDGK